MKAQLGQKKVAVIVRKHETITIVTIRITKPSLTKAAVRTTKSETVTTIGVPEIPEGTAAV